MSRTDVKNTLKMRVGGLTIISVGGHRDSIPYMNFYTSDDRLVGMPEDDELRKLQKMIGYVLGDHLYKNRKKRIR